MGKNKGNKKAKSGGKSGGKDLLTRAENLPSMGHGDDRRFTYANLLKRAATDKSISVEKIEQEIAEIEAAAKNRR